MATKKKNNSGKSKSKADLTKASTYAASKPKTQPAKSSTGNKPAKKEKKGLIAYFRGVRQELKKVVCPTREELTTDTIVVLVCVAFFALAFWLVDTGFLAALKGILGITLS